VNPLVIVLTKLLYYENRT